MKVIIGPYEHWFGPYQLADVLQRFGFSEKFCDKFGEYLDKTWISVFLNYFNKKQKRKVFVKIHPYDIWNSDHTLALIILPMLKEFAKQEELSPNVDDEDVPTQLKSSSATSVDEWEQDENFHKRWKFVLNEMIFAFEEIVQDSHVPEFDERIKNGLRLFGRYYQALWT